ncbi:hypothetical protein D9M70_512780 [compost metagenome]
MSHDLKESVFIVRSYLVSDYVAIDVHDSAGIGIHLQIGKLICGQQPRYHRWSNHLHVKSKNPTVMLLRGGKFLQFRLFWVAV